MAGAHSSPFTKRTLDGLLTQARKAGKPVERGDSHDHPGLRFRALASGKTGAWYYRFRDPDNTDANGRPRLKLKKLGSYPRMGLADARRAHEALVAERSDNEGRLAVPVETLKFKRMVDDYIAKAMDPATKDGSGEYIRSWREVRRSLDRDAVPAWGDRAVTEITRDDVKELLRHVGDDRGSPRQANRLLAYVRRVFNWGIRQGSYGLSLSPCDRLERQYSEVKRDEWLKPAELRRFVTGVPGILSPSVRDILLIALRTGQRIGEVAGLPWDELDDLESDAPTWYLPAARAKNGHAHEVPLPHQVVEILRRQDRGGRFVFPGRGSKGHVVTSSVDEAWAKVRNDLGLPAFRPHDTRHTARTYLAKAQCPRSVRNRITNHRERQSAADSYDHHGYDAEAREWLQKWNDELDRLAGINVVEMRA